MMKLATRQEGKSVDMAVWYKQQVDNHLEMLFTAEYGTYKYKSYQDCTEGYNYYNQAFLDVVEDIAKESRSTSENVIKMVNRMVRRAS